MTKVWYKSKTLWFNILGGIIVVLQYLGSIHIGDPRIIEGILALGNFILRLKTDTNLTITQQ